MTIETAGAMRNLPSPVGKTTQMGEAHAAPALYVYLLALGLFLLPFTRAFTIDVGFPLKIYEPVFAAAAFSFLFARPEIELQLLRKLILPALVFLLVAAISYLFLVYTNPVTAYNFRGGIVLDGLSRVAYVALAVAIFVMCAVASRVHYGSLIRAWIAGASVSALYVIYTSISMILFREAFLLPGIERHQTWSFSIFEITRSGTFEEGNFAGLYFLLTIVLALVMRSAGAALLALAGLLISISTSAYLGLLVVAMVYVMIKRNVIRTLPYVLVIAVIGFVVVTYFAEQGKFDSNSSAAVRLNGVMSAFAMFRDHPWIGAGLGQYGFQYDFYAWDTTVNELVTSERHIVNNVYAELLAETGLLGLAAFLWFLRNWMGSLYGASPRLRMLFAGGVGLLIGWLAYPSFSVAFSWAFIGISAGTAAALYQQQLRYAGLRARDDGTAGFHASAPGVSGLR